MKITELQHKKIAILGFGKEGQGSLKFLQGMRIKDITVFDKNPIEKCEVPHITGDGYLDNLSEFDLIIKTPGITPFQEKLEPYRDKIISQTSIFFANYTGKVIAITGTKGKSTTSTLLYESLKQAGYNVKLAGNIGKPVLDEIDVFSGESYDYVIYEMSSYMLQDFEPETYISVFNNVYRCHIDWHKTFGVYKQAKFGILKNAQYRLINNEFSDEVPFVGEYFGTGGKYTYDDNCFYIGETKILENTKTLLEGEHNKKNICAVTGVLDRIIGDTGEIEKILENILEKFSGLPDRMERIGEYQGIVFINDAIATTPESTMAAIETFQDGLQTLFLGGEDSGFGFSELRKQVLNSSIENIIAFPDTSEKVFPEILVLEFDTSQTLEIEGKSIVFFRTRSMKSGVDFAYTHTSEGKTALLSCAAPSFSLWKNYRDKAKEFKKYVTQY